MLDEETRYQLEIVKVLFEELVGCVAGCGCWPDLTPAWNSPERLQRFAERGFELWDPGYTLSDLVFALEWTCLEVDDETAGEASTLLELHLPTPDEFRDFFRSTLEALAAETERRKLSR